MTKKKEDQDVGAVAEVAIEETSEETKYDFSSTESHFAAFKDPMSEDSLKALICEYLQKLISDAGLEDYETIVIFDDDSLTSFHANRVYDAVKDLNSSKDILVIINSGGGEIGPAYLMSKTCKRLCKDKFVVSIPRKAKSAATLMALGANELHMGLLSELGPIDPQFGGFPALGLSNALEKIASIAERCPNASDMLAKYLTDNVNVAHLGLFERVNESAVQYAQRLLQDKKLPPDQSAETLADHFTNHYKDHGFVIDADEAGTLLGSKIVKENTPEYELGNSIFTFLEFNKILFNIFKNKDVRYVGSISDCVHLKEFKVDS